jgi:hypothetical protein
MEKHHPKGLVPVIGEELSRSRPIGWAGKSGAGEFTLVPFLDGSGAVELLRRRVFSQRLARSITH